MNYGSIWYHSLLLARDKATPLKQLSHAGVHANGEAVLRSFSDGVTALAAGRRKRKRGIGSLGVGFV